MVGKSKQWLNNFSMQILQVSKLSNMVKRAIISHMEGQKHKKNPPRNCILKTVKKHSFNHLDVNTIILINTIEQFWFLVTLTLTNSEIITAEIYWAFKCIYNNPLSSCDDMKSLFSNMFPDSNAAFFMLKDFSMLVLMKVLTKLYKSDWWTSLFDAGTR